MNRNNPPGLVLLLYSFSFKGDLGGRTTQDLLKGIRSCTVAVLGELGPAASVYQVTEGPFPILFCCSQCYFLNWFQMLSYLPVIFHRNSSLYTNDVLLETRRGERGMLEAKRDKVSVETQHFLQSSKKKMHLQALRHESMSFVFWISTVLPRLHRLASGSFFSVMA